MRILIDTNIIARIAQPSHRQHSIAQLAVEHLRSADHHLCVVPQIIYEFWSVCTRPSSENGLGMTVAEAVAEVAEIKTLFKLFRDERAIFQAWERLVAEHDVKGKSAHDARLVAAMKRHGLDRILTFNASDFARYPGLTVLTPDQLG